MKTKIILTLALTCALTSFGQGLVGFQNAAVGAQKISTNATAIGGGSGFMSTTASQYQFELFWGLSALTMTNHTASFLNSTTTAGVILGNGSIDLGIASGTTIFCQAFGWNNGVSLATAQATVGDFWGSSTVASVTLTASPLAGVPVFGSTATANAFTGFSMFVVTAVPEPSTMVLAGLGAASLLLFRRRKQA
ncbi:MAG: PEP-CTERM sorting domain-containing protein [Verrucomicrobia bacterium]|nr:PEP-CTERM sorting domain-containing protein [Verrucomicrobiota bacterium]